LGKLPFPAKKAFQNTQRAVLEFRMGVLNDFLMVICSKAEFNDEMCDVIREFLEPDTEDRKYNGGIVRTFVNPLKSGIRTIKNMPDSVIDGLSRIFLGKGAFKEQNFMENPAENSEYPALTSVLNLMDEVFDLQARSQWLRRGLINRLLGASFISQAANKKILQVTKSLIEVDKIESVLVAILNHVWPDGVRNNRVAQPREDSTKLRTKMTARIVLFSLLLGEFFYDVFKQ
jgi:sorting nexin-13